MSIERLSISRFAMSSNSAAWEQKLTRVSAWLDKVPLNRWQFLVRLLLIILLSFSLARLFWLVFPNPVIPPSAVMAPVVAAPLAGNGSTVDIAQLKSLAVFGKAAPVVQAQPTTPENEAVDSQLGLLLMGLVYSSEESLARAIITGGNSTDVYAVGNPLPVGNGVTLAKIMEDRVIVNNNGKFESVWLYQDNPNAPAISQSYTAPQRQAPAPAVAAPYSGAPAGSASDAGGGGGSDADRGVAEVSRNLSDVVAMSIYREGGKVVGYKIRPGRDAEKFKSLGLQSDDIVTSVNGMPLTNPAKIMEVYKNMGSTSSANLEILRNGNVITVDVVLQ